MFLGYTQATVNKCECCFYCYYLPGEVCGRGSLQMCRLGKPAFQHSAPSGCLPGYGRRGHRTD